MVPQRRVLFVDPQWPLLRIATYGSTPANCGVVDELPPLFLPDSWQLTHAWPAVNAVEAWQQWFACEIDALQKAELLPLFGHNKEGDATKVPDSQGTFVRGLMAASEGGWEPGQSAVDNALLVVDLLNGAGEAELTRERAEKKIDGHRPVAALQMIAHSLWPASPPPPLAAAGSEDSERAGRSRAEILKSLRLGVRQAYLGFELAETMSGRRLEDREAYEYIHGNGLPEKAGHLGELNDYELPVFDTWARYLREARKALGEQKYNRRAGRPIGASIVKVDEVEPPNMDE